MRWRRAALCLNGIPASVTAQPWVDDPALIQAARCTNAFGHKTFRYAA